MYLFAKLIRIRPITGIRQPLGQSESIRKMVDGQPLGQLFDVNMFHAYTRFAPIPAHTFISK